MKTRHKGETLSLALSEGKNLSNNTSKNYYINILYIVCVIYKKRSVEMTCCALMGGFMPVTFLSVIARPTHNPMKNHNLSFLNF